MTKQNHIHKFKRVKFKSGNQVFFCALPDCNFKTNIAFALGKRSICWRCGNSFIMNEYSLRLAKPHCENCHKPKGEIKESPVEPIPAFSNESESSADRLAAMLERATKEVEDDI